MERVQSNWLLQPASLSQAAMRAKSLTGNNFGRLETAALSACFERPSTVGACQCPYNPAKR
jgi:hypothetical protein